MSGMPGTNGTAPSLPSRIPDDPPPRVLPGPGSFFRMAMLQAFWICMAYAVFGTAFDLLRRLTHREMWIRATQFVDAPALMAMKHLEVLQPLLRSAAMGTVSPFLLRVAISACTFLGIFIQAFVLSAIFYAVLRFSHRRDRDPAEVHTP